MAGVATMTVAIRGRQTADAAEVVEIADRLREQLLETDARSVEPARSGRPPPGAKGGELLEFGKLVVELSPTVLPAVVAVVRAFLARPDTDKLVLEMDGDRLEIEGASAEQEDKALAAWVQRHREHAGGT
jgi:hypothetical protein